jgi:type IV secretory pathway VirB9-like protein
MTILALTPLLAMLSASASAALASPPLDPAPLNLPGGGEDDERLARSFRDTGVAPALERDHAALVPYGHGRTVVRCAPLRACALELEPGEAVLNTASGDSERWLVQIAAAGPGGKTPLVVVKPTSCDLSTNLLVATDRRLYEVALEAAPCHDADRPDGSRSGAFNPTLAYRGLTRFYYPDDLVRRWAEAAERQAAASDGDPLPLAAAQLASLHFTYSWDRERRFPWTPAEVFDDGRRTVIVLPAGARYEETPALFLVGEHGALSLLNYHVEHGIYITDRVLDHAVLVAAGSTGGRPARLEIVNHARRESRR